MVKTSSGSVAVTAIAIVAALLATSVASSALVEPAYAKQAPGEKPGAYCYTTGDETAGSIVCAMTKQQCEQSRENAIANGADVTSKCYKDKDFDFPPV
jgi:hypothetical protein